MFREAFSMVGGGLIQVNATRDAPGYPLRFADFANDPLVWVRQRTVHGSQLPESLLNQVHPIKGLLCGTGFLRISVRPGVRSAYVSPNAFAACCFLVRSFPVSGCPADSRGLC